MRGVCGGGGEVNLPGDRTGVRRSNPRRRYGAADLIEFPLAGGAPPPLVLELGVWLLAVASCYVLGDSELSVSGGAAECCQRPESDFRGPV